MSKVTVFDKEFEIYLTSGQIAARVAAIGRQMNEDLKDANPVFLAILNGSFFFAADLLKHVDFSYEVSFVKVTSYRGMEAGETVKSLIGLDENLAGRTVVLVEDIIDSGQTMHWLVKELKEINVSDIKIATLIFKPGSVKYPVLPDYTGFETPDEFLIGYGLDFDKKGRHYKDIYKIKRT